MANPFIDQNSFKRSHETKSREIVLPNQNMDSVERVAAQYTTQQPIHDLFRQCKPQECSHQYTLFLGFQQRVSKIRFPFAIAQKMEDENKSKQSALYTSEYKQFIDYLTSPNIEQIKKFEKFVLALEAQVREMKNNIKYPEKNPDSEPLTSINQPTEEESEPLRNSQSIPHSLSNLGVIKSPQTIHSNTSFTQAQVQILDVIIEPNVIEQNEKTSMIKISQGVSQLPQLPSVFDITQISQFFNEQFLQLKDLVIRYCTIVLPMYTTFEKNCYEFVSHFIKQKKTIQKTNQATNPNDIVQEFQISFSKFIRQFINTRIRTASNLVYKQFNGYIHRNENILLFSPTNLLINSIVIASKFNEQIQVTVLDTHSKDNIQIVEQLLREKISCTYALLQHFPCIAAQNRYDKCFIGADSISVNGNVLAKSGCKALSIMCQQFKIPLIAVATSIKFSDQENLLETAKCTTVQNNNEFTQEVVDHSAVNAIACEYGIIAPSTIQIYIK